MTTSRVREKALLAIAVVLGSVTWLAVVGGLVLVGLIWWDAQRSSASEAAADIVSTYGATTARCQDAGPDEFSCRMTFRGCAVTGRVLYDGPGIYPWVDRNPLAACRGYREP
jgi:hypothetical protein